MPEHLDFSDLANVLTRHFDDFAYWDAVSRRADLDRVTRRIRIDRRGAFRRLLEGRLFG